MVPVSGKFLKLVFGASIALAMAVPSEAALASIHPSDGRIAHDSTTGTVSGLVTNISSAPLQGICVNTLNGPSQIQVMTAADGTYTISGITPGSYYIEFSSCGTGVYATQLYNGTAAGASSPANATLVVVAAGSSTTNINAVMSASVGGISGTVSLAGGGPVSDVCVYVIPQSTGTVGMWPPPTTSGHFTAVGLVAGGYLVGFGFTCDDKILRYYDGSSSGTSSKAGAKVITVAAGSTVTGIDITLALPPPPTPITIIFTRGASSVASLSNSQRNVLNLSTGKILKGATVTITGYAPNSPSLATRRAKAIAKWFNQSSMMGLHIKLKTITKTHANKVTIAVLKQ